jgi:hypothetical protein
MRRTKTKKRALTPVSERHKAFLIGAPTELVTQDLAATANFLTAVVATARPSKLRDELLDLAVEMQASTQELTYRLELQQRKSA